MLCASPKSLIRSPSRAGGALDLEVALEDLVEGLVVEDQGDLGVGRS